jgi:site-specific recombinase XerC
MGMPPVENLTAEHLRHHLLKLYEKGNKPATISIRYRSLKSYYKWLVNEGERQDNPLNRIPPPKVPESIQKHYTLDEVGRLLLTCSTNSILDLRDKAVILVMLDTGLRSKELCELTVEDTDLKRMTLQVQWQGAGRWARIQECTSHRAVLEEAGRVHLPRGLARAFPQLVWRCSDLQRSYAHAPASLPRGEARVLRRACFQAWVRNQLPRIGRLA